MQGSRRFFIVYTQEVMVCKALNLNIYIRIDWIPDTSKVRFSNEIRVRKKLKIGKGRKIGYHARCSNEECYK